MQRYVITNDNFAQPDRFWNGCGWTDNRKKANRYKIVEARRVEGQMLKDKIPARIEKV